MTEISGLVEGVRGGDRRSLAKAITLVESTREADREHAVELLDALAGPDAPARRVGISGPPGVGKSTLIDALGIHLVDHGHRVAVLAVDPSSSRSGGSILGDKTRMSELARHPEAYVRPSPAAGELGGVARRTREALLVCEAAGFDVVLIETVGVGQSETAVGEMVDTFLLLVSPGAGDELQGVKRGIMELADVVAVTKADGDLAPAARRAVADHRQAVHLLRRRHASWEPPVLAVSASTGVGIPELWSAVRDHRDALEATGEFEAQRSAQAVHAFWVEVERGLLHRLRADAAGAERLDRLCAAVQDGEQTPTAAAWRALQPRST